MLVRDWRPDLCIEQAWQVSDAIEKRGRRSGRRYRHTHRGYEFELRHLFEDDDLWYAAFWGDEHFGKAMAATAQEAICLAAIAVLDSELEKDFEEALESKGDIV